MVKFIKRRVAQLAARWHREPEAPGSNPGSPTMKIAVLGGQFNPPHLGHIIMAQQVLEFTDSEQVWLAPCYQHTFDKKMASVKHRATMTKMICNKNIKFCDQEIKNKLSGDTIKLMDLLVKKYPQHEFSFIIGSDNLPDFKKWGHWEKLIKKYNLESNYSV